jgi:hypothetical protein
MLLYIIQTTTVNNPVTLNSLQYNCVIMGDGKIHHFGLDFPDQDPSLIYLKCDKIPGEGQA